MSARRKLTVYLVMALIAAMAAGLVIVQQPRVAQPEAANGEIDLSHWDFRKQGNVKLDGEWAFYPNRLLAPSEIDGDSPGQERYIRVPSGWNNSDTSDYMPDLGVGTYRLRVKADPSVVYGIKTTYIRNSSKIFVDDLEVGGSGNPVEVDDRGYTSRNTPVTAFFKPEGETFAITIQAANFDYYRGGIIQSLYFGSQADIQSEGLYAVLLDIMNVSFLLISAFYYMSIYLKRPQYRHFLYFALFCLGFAFVVATSSEKIFMQLFPSIPYMLVLKIKFVVILAGICCLCAFIRHIEPSFMPSSWIKLAVFGTAAYAALIAIVPVFWMDRVMVGMTLFVLAAIEFNLLRAIATKRYGQSNRRTAVQLFVVVSLLFVQLFFMSLYLNSMINTIALPILTQLLFLGVVAVMFAEQYTQAYDDMEEMSRQLIETDKLKDEFLIRTSHEFKTPLHGIMNLARITIDQSGDALTKQQSENLGYIISLSARLSTLVNDIIDFQSLQGGRLAMQKTVFDINGTVQATIDVLIPMRKDRDVRLLNRVPAGKYYLFADENRFTQILVNLIGNALKFTEKGSVAVTAESREGFVYIRVSDTGVGMTEEMQQRIFQENQAIGEVNFTEVRSSGLGLRISKLLASHMGGELDLKWSEPDQGAVFEVALPEAEETARRQLAEIRPSDGSSDDRDGMPGSLPDRPDARGEKESDDSGKVKIMLVDDEASNIQVLQQLFPSDRYHSLIAYDGESALQLLRKHGDISLVLLDVMMPGLSGFEVCRRIREKYPMYKLPVLLLTVRNSSADIAAGLDAGANDFLVKPFDSRELSARASTLLQMKEAVQNAIKAESLFLQSQIKPHFIYNALSIMMSLCYKDGPRAGKLLGEFSNYLRLSFDLDPQMAMVSLRREISLVKSYAALEQARFGDRLRVEIDVDEALMEITLPALTLQPLVENAIRHGLMKRLAGGTVRLEAKMGRDELRLTIRDDGTGFPAAKLEAVLLGGRADEGVGLINVHKRLLNEYGRGLQIESREGEGAQVTIFIPIRTKTFKKSG
ncbi:ATP-binding protein [Paenibacillaceae bacterium WGS1546]|uniref:ATP-binding protein n=1 Tax=Cohnella sp. WGS1546 TaxID=3366810 RepID=UPI00372D06D6